MRVISGKLKGKSINFIKSTTTRPLRDSVKENIFNILAHSNIIKINVKSSKVLDLYSGVGSFGIECISREASEVLFVERSIQTSSILKENLKNLSITEKTNLYNEKVENVINKIKNKKFTIFFLDPPFTDFNFINNLILIKQNKLFSKNHIVIIHREKNSKDIFDGILNILIKKFYGRSEVIFATFF